MKIPRFLPAALLSGLLLVTTAQVRAQSVTYNFTQFGGGGQITPLLNVAPDVGSSSFRANFTSAPNSGGFRVSNFQPNSLFSGNSLTEPAGTVGNVLTVTLNTAVNLVNLVFATNGPGALTFASSSGGVTVASTAQGGSFPGGSLTFSSATPFTSFTLTDGAGPEFGIDNLTMRVAAPTGVPDSGTTVLLLGMSVAVLLAGASRARAKLA